MEQLRIEDFMHIKIKDFKKWLDLFDEDENVSLIVVDPNKRLHYKSGEIYPMLDMPAIIYEIVGEEGFDET